MAEEGSVAAGRTALGAREHERWVDTAESTMASARREATAGAHHVAVFLAEQSAQCAVKAVLHGIGATAKALGHGLVALGQAISAEVGVPVPEEAQEGMQRLSQAYMPSRYPEALPDGSPVDHYGPAHARQALADAGAVLGFCDRTWQTLLAAQHSAPAAGNEGPAA